MNGFTSETARIAGRTSKRGKAKITLSIRKFLFELLNENRDKFKLMLEELEPKEFIQAYMKLIPYVISIRQKQQFEVSELSRNEIIDIVKDITEER